MKASKEVLNTVNEIEALVMQSPDLASSKAKVIFKEFISSSEIDEIFQVAVTLLEQEKYFSSDQLCRLLLEEDPKNIRALHILGIIAARMGFSESAVDLFIACLEINPSLVFIRFDLVNALFDSGNFPLALKQSEYLLEKESSNLDYLGMKAASLVKLGDFERAINCYEVLLRRNPNKAQVHVRYGVVLKTLGRSDEAITAFRNALTINPGFGEAYWSLANMKTHQYTKEDIEFIESYLSEEEISRENKVYFSYSHGRALEEQGDFDKAFESYEKANAQLRQLNKYDSDVTSKQVEILKEFFDQKYFEELSSGCDSIDPIFVVGLPRSGSTLVEQILSCHSRVDATMELIEIPAMVRSLNYIQKDGKARNYPNILNDLKSIEFTRFGEEYLKRTKVYRRGAVHFIDKALGNFFHIGLIASILPNAKIIDLRRDPLACGMSIYKQFFASGFDFTHNLEDIGRYYNDYVSLMDHWHSVLPGRILTVQYEKIVNDIETEVRNILEYCGLGYEQECLDFYKSKRAVATISSEQVRQPIYRDSIDHWKNYDKHLGLLKSTLGV